MLWQGLTTIGILLNAICLGAAVVLLFPIPQTIKATLDDKQAKHFMLRYRTYHYQLCIVLCALAGVLLALNGIKVTSFALALLSFSFVLTKNYLLQPQHNPNKDSYASIERQLDALKWISHIVHIALAGCLAVTLILLLHI